MKLKVSSVEQEICGPEVVPTAMGERNHVRGKRRTALSPSFFKIFRKCYLFPFSELFAHLSNIKTIFRETNETLVLNQLGNLVKRK